MLELLVCFALAASDPPPASDAERFSKTTEEAAGELRGALRPKPPKPLPNPKPEPEPEVDRRPIIPRPFIPVPPDEPRFHPVRKLFRAGVEAACGMFGFVAIAPRAILFVEVIVLVGMLGVVAAIVFGVIWLVKKA